MCTPSRGTVGPCFVVFAKALFLRGNRAEENGCLFKLSVRRPGAEFISAKGAGKAVDGGLGEGGRVGAVQEGEEFITHDCVGETSGAVVCHKGCMCGHWQRVEMGFSMWSGFSGGGGAIR